MHLSMVFPRMGGRQPTGIRLGEAHVGREFDILNVPRVGNLTQPPSLKIPSSHLDQFTTFRCVNFFVKDGIMKLAF